MAWTTGPVFLVGQVLRALDMNNISTDLNILGPVISGIIPAAGTTATAGTGFTYTHGVVGTYVFSFTSTPFSVTPLVVATMVAANQNTRMWLSSLSSSGFMVNITDAAGAGLDGQFNFVAKPTT